MNTKATRRPPRGHAILEVLIAAAMLAAGLTALLSAVPTILRVITDVRELSDADRVAAASVDQIVMTWTADRARLRRTGNFRADDAGRETRRDNEGRFRVAWALVDDRPIAANTLIRVTVDWTSQDGRARRRVLRTYVNGLLTGDGSDAGDDD